LGSEEATLEHLTDLARTALGADAGRWNHPLIPWIVDAASGKVPDRLAAAPPAQRNPFKGHATAWFKSIEGGQELARKLRELGVWEQQLREILQPFIDAVAAAQAGVAAPAAQDLG
jgi:putative ATP-dependent endonuclease of OLD family